MSVSTKYQRIAFVASAGAEAQLALAQLTKSTATTRRKTPTSWSRSAATA